MGPLSSRLLPTLHTAAPHHIASQYHSQPQQHNQLRGLNIFIQRLYGIGLSWFDSGKNFTIKSKNLWNKLRKSSWKSRLFTGWVEITNKCHGEKWLLMEAERDWGAWYLTSSLLRHDLPLATRGIWQDPATLSGRREHLSTGVPISVQPEAFVTFFSCIMTCF